MQADILDLEKFISKKSRRTILRKERVKKEKIKKNKKNKKNKSKKNKWRRNIEEDNSIN